MSAQRYVAFLRGINVGGNKKVPMEKLRHVFTAAGYTEVKTLLNSGNVLFTAPETNEEKLTHEIMVLLEKNFGFAINVLIRKGAELEKLIARAPFKGVPITPQTRLYVTFLTEKPTSALKIPYLSPEKDFSILQVTAREICSVFTVSTQRNSTDAMGILEKEYGKKVTTRNWNTILRIVKM